MIDPILSHALAALGGFAAAAPLLGVAAWRIRRQAAALAAPAAPSHDAVAERTRRIAHELNNTLTAAGGFAELARSRTIEDPDAAASLDQVVLGVQRATILVRRLTGAGRPEATAPAQKTQAAGTVLVVDDETAVRDLAALALLDHGFAVHRATSGTEALALLDSAPGTVDLVLTDVMMPGMTGPELARLLTDRHPGLPVVYMSGYEHRRLANERMIGRDDPCVAKPFAPDHLVAVVSETITAARPGSAPLDRAARVA